MQKGTDMKVTKTIQLSDEERQIVEKALGLIDEMSESANNSMVNVFNHLTEISELVDDFKYSAPNTIYIDEI